MAQFTPKVARMLSSLFDARCRQLIEAKCLRAGVELVKIDPTYTSTVGAAKYASGQDWSVHAAAAVIVRRRQKLTERPLRTDTVIRVPVRGGRHSGCLQGEAEIRV